MMEKFTQTLPDGHTVTLPRFENLSTGLLRKVRKLDGADQTFTILEELATEEDLEHLDKLDRGKFNAFVKAWRDGSSVDLGESSASSI